MSEEGGVSLGGGVLGNVPVLTGPENYSEWWSKMQFMIRGSNAFSLIDRSPEGDKEVLLDNKAQALVVVRLGPHPMDAISGATNLKLICSTLKGQYAEKGWGIESVLAYSLFSLRQDNFSGVSDYIVQFWSYVQRLNLMGVKIDNKLLLYIFLEGLGDKYEGFRSNLHQNS